MSDRKERDKIKTFTLLGRRPLAFHWKILSESEEEAWGVEEPEVKEGLVVRQNKGRRYVSKGKGEELHYQRGIWASYSAW